MCLAFWLTLRQYLWRQHFPDVQLMSSFSVVNIMHYAPKSHSDFIFICVKSSFKFAKWSILQCDENYTNVFLFFTHFNAFSNHRILEYWCTINCFIEVFQISDSSSDSNSDENQGSDAESDAGSDENNDEFEVDSNDNESDIDDGDDEDFDDIFFELSEDASNLWS